jgi:phosphoribosylamine--glycine ligase
MTNTKIEIDNKASATIIMVSGGYPEAYEKNKPIHGIDSVKNSIVFHSGTTNIDGNIMSAGGRVLAISSLGDNVFEALEKSYDSAAKISFDNAYYRKDLGFDLK